MGIVLLFLVVLGASADSILHFKSSKSEQPTPYIIAQEEKSTITKPSAEQNVSETTIE